MRIAEILESVENVTPKSWGKRPAVETVLRKLQVLEDQDLARSRWPLEQRLAALRKETATKLEARQRQAEQFAKESEALKQQAEEAIASLEAELADFDAHSLALAKAITVLEADLKEAIVKARAAEAAAARA